MTRWCTNCDMFQVYAKDRCRQCYRWWSRRGDERPLDRAEAQLERLLRTDVARPIL